MFLLIFVTGGHKGTKAKNATSCGKAFVTNILLASAGEVEPPRSLRSLRGLDFLAVPAGVATFHYNQCNEHYSSRWLDKAYCLGDKLFLITADVLSYTPRLFGWSCFQLSVFVKWTWLIGAQAAWLRWEQRELKTLDWAKRGKRGKRLKPCPRKASAWSGNQRHI